MNKFKKIILTAALAVTALSVTAFSAGCNKDTEKKFSLSFETNGATAISAESATEGSKYTLPKPEREGYEFVGWYTDASFSGSPVTEITVSSDMTFYAKWTKLYTITLDANGGSVSSATITVKEGASVYDAVKDIVPVKGNLTFGAWFVGGSELTSSVVANADMTLVAKYKVGYTIEIYLQKADKSGYEKSETLTLEGYAGEAYPGTTAPEGFTEVANEDAKTEGTLSENASENVFRHYYDRKSVNLKFISVDPVSGEETTVELNDVAAATEIEAPSDYEAEGYCLIGWSETEGGKVAVYANYIYDRLYNKGDEKRNVFAPDASKTYYAVWAEAYTDMFGGADKVYYTGEGKTAYVERLGVFYRAEINGNVFRLIHDKEDKTLVKGKLNDDMTYVYSNLERNNLVAYEYIPGEKNLNKTKSIIFDEYNGLTYIEYNDKGIETANSKGYYTVGETGAYEAFFEEGARVDQMLVFITGKVNDADAFQVRNDEDIALGTVLRAQMYDGELVTFREGYYSMTFNGFGVATFAGLDNSGKQVTSNYYYSFDEARAVFTLRTAQGQTAAIAKLLDINGRKVYAIYDKTTDKNIVVGKATLATDGALRAEYNDGNTTVEGYYDTTESVFGYVVNFYGDNKENYKFLVTSVTQEVEGEDGKTKTETTYSFEKKDSAYAEYYFSAEKGIYYAPLLVIENANGDAKFYGYTANKTYELVSVGKVAQNGAAGAYRYTAKEYFIDKFSKIEEKEADGTITYCYYIKGDDGEDKLWMQPLVNVLMVEYADIMVDSTSTQYSVNYWSSYKIKDGDVQTLTKTYDGSDSDKLTVWGGFARYNDGKDNYYGTFAANKAGYYTLTYTATENKQTVKKSLYFELDTEKASLTKLQFAPYKATELLADGTASKDCSMALDGKGSATLTYTEGEGETATKQTLTGEVTTTGAKTVFGQTVYRFRSGSTVFEFIGVTVSNTAYFARYNQAVNGDYTLENTKLTLDGFGYNASYTDAEENEIIGYYVLGENGAITFISENGYLYFDLKDERTFTKRGAEYGQYVVLNNMTNGGMSVMLDGYGKLTVSVTTLNEETGKNETKNIATDVPYEIKDNSCIFSYVAPNGNTVNVKGQFGYIRSNNRVRAALLIQNEDIVMNYVNTADWSVLSLDGYGNATKVDKDGKKETGTYLLITDNLLYYTTSSDASIYKYDSLNGTISPVENKARGYYTKGLESLVFTKYGFAVFNGATRYYYNVVDGVCYIYHQEFDENGQTLANANKYGFVEEVFGEFDAEKQYNGKTYYSDDGGALIFDRDPDTADNFKIPFESKEGVEYRNIGRLTFTPSGSEQFAVSGIVQLGEKPMKCTVYRLVDGEKSETFAIIQINALSYFRLDLEVEYNGGNGNNTYNVVSMKRIVSVQSANYWYMVLIYQMFTGKTVSLPNTYGSVQIVYEYNADGSAGANYVTATFGQSMRAYDANGNALTFDKASFEQVGDSGMNFIATFNVNNAEGEENPDTYTYKMYFSISAFQYMRGVYAYNLVALTRVQTLETTNGYTVEIERVITSDNYQPGYLFSAKMYKGEVKEENLVNYSVRFSKNNVWYLVSRTLGENDKITATKYYKLTLVEKDLDIEENEDGTVKKVVAPYERAEVSEEEGKTVYAKDGTDYVDLDSDGNPLLMTISGRTYVVTASEKGEEEGTVIVIVGGAKKYSLKFSEVEGETVYEATEVEMTAEEN